MAEITVNPPDSLVKFEAPLYLDKERKTSTSVTAAKTGGAESAGAKLDEMVNAMLPPREWMEDSGVWVQYVSKEPASRLDVISLQEQLDKRLNERKARESGICPVREELYKQCFDELIRHVTLDGPERGLLLMRVKDEMRMTVDAYKTLFDSSVSFGIKKQLKAEQGLPTLETEVSTLEEECSALELELNNLKSKLEIIEKRETERKASDDKRRKEELDFLKYQGQHLDSFLKQMNTAK